jgi:hypothetical protein
VILPETSPETLEQKIYSNVAKKNYTKVAQIDFIRDIAGKTLAGPNHKNSCSKKIVQK